MGSYIPPFVITPKILQLSLQIQDILGQLKNTDIIKPSVKLRKQNKIKTIHHSLAIEGNTLTIDQITAILEDKKVLGSKKEIDEVKNAIHVYESIGDYDALSEKHFLSAHKVLMKSLISDPGHYRTTNVGILKGTKVSHVAPQAKQVSALMGNLFSFIIKNPDISFLIKACVFHYELEFIHPFADGNGRMGRLWQQIILMKHSAVFEYLSVESLINKNQKQYYKILESCDKLGESTLFIQFSLELVLQTLKDFKLDYKPEKLDAQSRLSIAHSKIGSVQFSRKNYIELFPEISTATASRDLNFGVTNKILKMSGEKSESKYYFIKK
jgi:Fic family protein